MSKTVELPSDIVACHNLISKMALQIEDLFGRLNLANQRLYGQSSEQSKYIEDEINQKIESIKKQKGMIQLELFTNVLDDINKYQAEADAALEKSEEKKSKPKKQRKKTKGKNLRLDELTHLETIECHHGDDLECCPECSNKNLTELPSEETRELDIIPPQIVIKKHITHKVVCEECKSITRGDKPLPPLNKCMAGANLLAYIIHSRFDLYLPYYRLHRVFKTFGVEISQANLCNWTNRTSEDIFTPLYNELVKDVINTDVIFVDETTIKELAKGKCIQRYLWGYTNIKSKNIVFEYSDRSRVNPSNFLKDFKNGFLITDKYSGYNEICKENDLIRGLCWAHARRKFHEIIKASKDPDDLKDVKYIFKLISDMLNEDKKIRKGNPKKITERRDQKIRPMVDHIFKSLETLEKTVGLLKGSLNKAIKYVLDSQQEFKNFLLHPDVEPTNNVSERNIRFITLGRKNWMFAGSPRGGRTTAVTSSIIASARAHDLNILEYLTYIIENLPKAKMSEVVNFLPQNCPQFKSKPNLA